MKSKHIPGVEKPPLLYRKWVVELLSSVPVMAGATFAAYKNWDDAVVGYALAAVAIWAAGSSVIKIAVARRQDQQESPETTHEGLYAAISTLHSAVTYWCDKGDGQDLDIRATFHRVVPPLDDPSEIQQIIPYIGGDGDGSGRRFSLNTGITGKAIRDLEPYILSSNAKDELELRASLVTDLGYTRPQAKKVSPGRYSAIAVPVIDKSGQHVLGVIYLDSLGRHVFDEEEITQMILRICDSIGDFVTKRY